MPRKPLASRRSMRSPRVASEWMASPATSRGAADHGLVLRFGAEGRVDLAADAVEVAVHGGRVFAPAEAAGALHGAGVHAADADVTEDAPELGIAQALQHRLARPRDLRRRVR